MFNNKIKKEALAIYEREYAAYSESYKDMITSCENFYEERKNVVKLIKFNQKVINSIANKPKTFDTKIGKINLELSEFKETENYADKAYKEALEAAKNIVSGVSVGIGVASMAPTALMSIATTFGKASTGTAIRTLSGAAAQKAAVAWVGRTFAGFAVKEGAGMVAGRAFFALAGPLGWGITGASVGSSLIKLSKKNKEIADSAEEEARALKIARKEIDEAARAVGSLRRSTRYLYNDINSQKKEIKGFMNLDFATLEESDKMFLGTLVNNTLSLTELLNKTVE